MRMIGALRSLRLEQANRSSCYIELLSGTRPASVGTSLNGGTILVSFRGAGVFGVTVDGVLTANNILSVNAAASGAVSWFRARPFNSTSPFLDGLVSGPGGGGDLIIGDVNVVAGELTDFVQWVETEGNAD